MALRYYGSGCFQREDADIHGVHQSTISRCVHRVTILIAQRMNQFVAFPTPAEYAKISNEFRQKRGFPGVIGALDGTHVRIMNPGGEDSELFRNRKGWFSINVQMLCDDKLVIRDVVASHKGSTHDSRIFNECVLKDKLEILPRPFHVLGDRGYGCQRYLMTPLVNPRTRPERQYNFAQSSTRMAIERTFGIMKRRFPCLTKGMNFKPDKCCTVIVACVVLYNFARLRNDNGEMEDNDVEDQNQFDGVDNAQGSAKRQTIIANYFT